MLSGALVTLAALLGFLLGVIKGAAIAGPIAGWLSAFLEPLVRPIREKITVHGNRLFERPGIALNRYLFKEEDAMFTGMAAQMEEERGQEAARDLFHELGFDISGDKYKANLSRLQDAWNRSNQVWNRTNPVAFQLGRNVISETMIFRPQHFAQNVLIGMQGAEIFSQSLEQLINRVIARHPDNESEISGRIKALKKAVARRFELSQKGSDEKNEKHLEECSAELMRLGLKPEEVKQIIAKFEQTLIYLRFTAASLASEIFHDFQFPEYNRALPREWYSAFKKMRNCYGLDYYQRYFNGEVAKILDQIGFQLDVPLQNVIGFEPADHKKKTIPYRSGRTRH